MVPSLLSVLVSVVSRDTPATFCLGRINWRRLAPSLDFSVVKRVWSFLSYWELPSWAASIAISYS